MLPFFSSFVERLLLLKVVEYGRDFFSDIAVVFSGLFVFVWR